MDDTDPHFTPPPATWLDSLPFHDDYGPREPAEAVS